MEQNREPEIDPPLHSDLIYDNKGKHGQWGDASLFNKWHWENGTHILHHTQKLSQNQLKTWMKDTKP